MTINLKKGGNINLSKEDPGLKNILLGLGWDPRATDGKDFDLDASVFLTDSTGKVTRQEDFVFYNNLKGRNDAVIHMGDNRDGEGDGDDEQVSIALERLPSEIEKIIVAVTIHDAPQRGQNFGQVGNAFVRLVNNDTQSVVARYDLTEDASTETAMIFCELYRHGGDWKFKAVGQGYLDGLQALVDQFISI